MWIDRPYSSLASYDAWRAAGLRCTCRGYYYGEGDDGMCEACEAEEYEIEQENREHTAEPLELEELGFLMPKDLAP